MDHYDHSKKTLKYYHFLTLSSLNLTHMQTKTPLTLPFILFPLQRKKYILQKVKTNLTPLQTLRDKAC